MPKLEKRYTHNSTKKVSVTDDKIPRTAHKVHVTVDKVLQTAQMLPGHEHTFCIISEKALPATAGKRTGYKAHPKNAKSLSQYCRKGTQKFEKGI